MPSSTTQNTEGKRIYASEPERGEKRMMDGVEKVFNGAGWVDASQYQDTPKRPAPVEVKNTAKAPSPADLEDKPDDSPLIRASKKRQRAQRDAMKMGEKK